PLARGDRLCRDHAIAVDLRLSRYELGADPGAGEIGFHESLYGVNRRPISSVHALREGDETGSRPLVPAALRGAQFFVSSILQARAGAHSRLRRSVAPVFVSSLR